jgi:hypothetical protein
VPIFFFSFIADETADSDTGTYFGTEEEYKALNFEQRLSKDAKVSVTLLDNWLGAVGNWAETEALKLAGGIVCVY